MPEFMLNLVFAVFLCLLAALLLLTAGFWGGYLYKQYTVAQVAAVADQTEARLEALIHRYFADGKLHCERLSLSSRDLHTLVHESPQVTPQLVSAIEQIGETANQLTKTLAAIEQLKSGIRNIPGPNTIAADVPPASPLMLTRQEMGTLTYDETREESAELNPAQRRYHFTCTQRAAVWMPDEPYPLASDFRPVKCRNLSAAGISFLWPDKPEFDHVIMAIGPTGSPIYIAAEIVHSKAVFMFNEVGYLIDCKFKKRIEIAAPSKACYALEHAGMT